MKEESLLYASMKTPFCIIPPANAAAHLETNEQENDTDLYVLVAVVLFPLRPMQRQIYY